MELNEIEKDISDKCIESAKDTIHWWDIFQIVGNYQRYIGLLYAITSVNHNLLEVNKNIERLLKKINK